MDGDILPLFPLDVVLFPGMPLPLHIFERRYKRMIRQCRERREPFGVLWGRPEGLAEVGCSAEVVKVVREYGDGRSDILTIGQRRFRLLQSFDDLPYLQGRVDYLADEEESPEELVSQHLTGLYRRAFRCVHGQPPPSPAEEDLLPLSFRIAAALPLDLAGRQQLLELSSERRRQFLLAKQLEALLPQLERVEKAKKQAGGNGFGR